MSSGADGWTRNEQKRKGPPIDGESRKERLALQPMSYVVCLVDHGMQTAESFLLDIVLSASSGPDTAENMLTVRQHIQFGYFGSSRKMMEDVWASMP